MSQFQPRRAVRFALLAASGWSAVLVVGLIAVRAAGALEPAELLVYDLFLRLRDTPEPVAASAVVAIDDTALEAWDWPVPDGRIAAIIERVVDAGAGAIAIDIYRDRPVEPGHDALLNSFANPIVHGAMKFATEGEAAVSPPPALADSRRFGFVDIPVDDDGVVRRALLYLDDGETVYPSLALQPTLSRLAAEGISQRGDPDDPAVMRLGRGRLGPFKATDGPYEAADARGYQMLLDFRRPLDAIPTVDALALVNSGDGADVLKDRIVFVGITSDQVKDFMVTPRSVQTRSGLVHGVFLHAWTSDQLVRLARGETRPLRTPGVWVEAVIIAIIGVAGLGFGLFMASARGLVLAGTAGVAIVVAGAFWLFESDVWVPVVPAALAGAGTMSIAVGGRAAGERRERQVLMRLFAQQVSPEIAEELWRRRGMFTEDGLPRPLKLPATILFLDLVGSTAIADALEPEVHIGWVGRFLERMAEAAIGAGGFVDKYTGDGLMAVFGAPVPHESPDEIAADARAAAECALAMEKALTAFNAEERARGNPEARMRIGIHTGPVYAGLVGAAQRAQYTVMGSAVNAAARLEALKAPLDLDDASSGPCRTLMSASTAELIADTIGASGGSLEQAGTATLRGFADPITIYHLRGGHPVMTNGGKQ